MLTVKSFYRRYWLFMALNRRAETSGFQGCAAFAATAARHWPRRPFGRPARGKASRRRHHDNSWQNSWMRPQASVMLAVSVA